MTNFIHILPIFREVIKGKPLYIFLELFLQSSNKELWRTSRKDMTEKNDSDFQNLEGSGKVYQQQRKMLKFWWIDNSNFANIVSEIGNERVR